jgi:hypothetical protein
MPEPRYPAARWAELGEALTARRIQLGYPHRPEFCALPGALGEGTVKNLELGRKPDGYEPATIIHAEVHYRLRRGAVRRFLAGATDELATPDLSDDDLGQLRQVRRTIDEIIARAAG